MKIEITNDNQNSYQSWSAKCVLNSDHQNGQAMQTFQAYGGTEAEARINLIKTLVAAVRQLAKLAGVE
jgi:hypothetical protein